MGLSEIATAFARARAEGRPALMPYWPLGYPDADTSLQVVRAIAEAGADMIELGVPFSDPLADGVVIQKATQIALERGISVAGCMALTREARTLGVRVPAFAMGYLNPAMAYGEAAYVRDWAAAGVDGLILPDLPPADSAVVGEQCAAAGMALVQFVAPTSPEKHLALAARHASGFVYVVQVTGVTGARTALADGLREYVQRVKAHAGETPVVVGFGVSTPAHVREIGTFADGAIVASALIRHAGEAPDPARAAYEFVRELRG
jgi:tryptophan synthase alpha chain